MSIALQFLHQRLAIALVLMAGLLGIWGTISFLRRRAVSGGFRSSFVLLAALTAVQSLAGAGLLASGIRPHNLLHIVYGIFAIIFLPGIYFYTARGARSREAAFLAAACWIVLVAYLRGVITGV